MQDKRGFEQLTDENRGKLHELRGQGVRCGHVAESSAATSSTVSRELSGKSADVAGGRVYLPDHAILVTKGRTSKMPSAHQNERPDISQTIVIEIQKGRSPEIIAGRLQERTRSKVIIHETLYDFIYDSDIGKRDKLYEYLPRGKKRRSKKHGRKSQKSRLEGRVFIEARSKEANDRSEVGHWETDSVLCKYRKR